MKNKTVSQLKEEGNQVSVEHGRVFNTPTGTEVMSRREFAAEQEKNPTPFELNNHGGYTKVNIVTKDGRTLYGKYSVPAGQQFNRKRGLTAAIGRALKGMR